MTTGEVTTYDIYLNIDSRTSMESTWRETTRNKMVLVVKVLKKEAKTKAPGIMGKSLTGLGANTPYLALPLTSIQLSQSEGLHGMF